jgi:hypothetical protein
MSQEAISKLNALRKRLDERSQHQPGFSVIFNDHLPGRPISIAILSAAPPGNVIETGSFQEFCALQKQIVPLLLELGLNQA